MRFVNKIQNVKAEELKGQTVWLETSKEEMSKCESVLQGENYVWKIMETYPVYRIYWNWEDVEPGFGPDEEYEHKAKKHIGESMWFENPHGERTFEISVKKPWGIVWDAIVTLEAENSRFRKNEML